jgi:hypothetical protein
MSIYEDEFIVEDNSFSGGQEITCLLWNSKIHNRVHNNPRFVHKLNQTNPIYNITYSSLNTRFNIIIPQRLCLPDESASFRLS